jgi:hypothetical protein
MITGDSNSIGPDQELHTMITGDSNSIGPDQKLHVP